jgi:hypothetical protein
MDWLLCYLALCTMPLVLKEENPLYYSYWAALTLALRVYYRQLLHRRHSYTGVVSMASDSLFFPSTPRYIRAKAVKAAPLTSPRF